MNYDDFRKELTIATIKISNNIDVRFKANVYCGVGFGIEISDKYFFNTTSIIITLPLLRFSIEIY